MAANSKRKREDGALADTIPLAMGGHGLILGCRIPKDYFLCKGTGDADTGGGVDPWETGSYDMALEAAGIHNYNIVKYTSVIPAEATQVDFSNALENFHHGSVLEVIMAQNNGNHGDRISAGVAMCQVKRKNDNKVIGGYAAEYEGHAREEEVCKILESDLQGIFDRRYNPNEHEMVKGEKIVSVMEVEKSYGTVIAAICFCSYIYPLITPSNR